MASEVDKIELLKLINLNEQKIKETLKNEQLTKFLVDVITYVNVKPTYEKNNIKL